MGCDDARIAQLNGHFRGKAKPTNVPGRQPIPRRANPAPIPTARRAASWATSRSAYDTCAREAAAQGKPMADHVVHLLVHATLHLTGYDHEIDADAETMEDAERSVLAALGISDPYL